MCSNQTLQIVLLLFMLLVFGCTNNAKKEDSQGLASTEISTDVNSQGNAAASSEPVNASSENLDSNRPIVGRWKLQKLENKDMESGLNPQAKSDYERQNQMIQEKGYFYFRADGRFEGNLRGLDDDKGTWEQMKEPSDKLEINIGGEPMIFEVEVLAKDALVLKRKAGGQTLRWRCTRM